MWRLHYESLTEGCVKGLTPGGIPIRVDIAPQPELNGNADAEDVILRLEYERLKLLRGYDDLLCLEGLRGVEHLADSIARAFCWLNTKVVVSHTQPAPVEYQAWTFLASARSEDQWEGLITVTVNAASGAALDFPDPLTLPEHKPSSATAPAAVPLYTQAARHALNQLARQATNFVERTEARLGRDRKRLHEYYHALLEDAGHKHTRVKREPTAEEHAARRRAVDLELRRKLTELDERYALSIQLAPVTLVRTELVALAIDCEVHRKKAQATRRIYWNPLTKTVEPLSCSRCGATIYAVAFSDGAVLPLCAACASPPKEATTQTP